MFLFVNHLLIWLTFIDVMFSHNMIDICLITSENGLIGGLKILWKILSGNMWHFVFLICFSSWISKSEIHSEDFDIQHIETWSLFFSSCLFNVSHCPLDLFNHLPWPSRIPIHPDPPPHLMDKEWWRRFPRKRLKGVRSFRCALLAGVIANEPESLGRKDAPIGKHC